jgi:hypothetical protein
MKITAPPIYRFLGFNTQGDVGGMTMYTSKDKGLVIFAATSPKVPASRRQTHHRNRLRLVALAWRALSAGERDTWAAAAHKANLRITGFNLFAYTMLTRDRGPARTVAANTHTTLNFPDDIPT